jgi:hypothetical protein
MAVGTYHVRMTLEGARSFAKMLPERIPEAVTRAMYQALSMGGNMAATQYMIRSTEGPTDYFFPPDVRGTTRLTWRSGRLASALIGKASSRGTAGGSAGRGTAAGGVQEGIHEVRRVDRAKWIGILDVSAVPYAHKHEFGNVNQIPTMKQRGFFWAMWRESRHLMWKALYLKSVYMQPIITPARPFLGPAWADPDFKTGVDNIFANSFQKMVNDGMVKTGKRG